MMLLRHADECRVGFTPPEYVPAFTRYGPGNTARVTHPLGDDHPNAVATRERLARKRFIVTAPATRNEITP